MQGDTKLVVSNLTRNVKDEHLQEIFGTYGKVLAAEVQMDRAVNLPKGYANVEFELHEDAQKAIDCMNGGQLDGNVIR